MSDLQASLIMIGGVIVVGVISFNKWQEWRAKKSVDSAFSALNDDVLMNADSKPADERQEPFIPPAEPAVRHADDAPAVAGHTAADQENTDAHNQPEPLPFIPVA